MTKTAIQTSVSASTTVIGFGNASRTIKNAQIANRKHVRGVVLKTCIPFSTKLRVIRNYPIA